MYVTIFVKSEMENLHLQSSPLLRDAGTMLKVIRNPGTEAKAAKESPRSPHIGDGMR